MVVVVVIMSVGAGKASALSCEYGYELVLCLKWGSSAVREEVTCRRGEDERISFRRALFILVVVKPPLSLFQTRQDTPRRRPRTRQDELMF